MGLHLISLMSEDGKRPKPLRVLRNDCGYLLRKNRTKPRYAVSRGEARGAESSELNGPVSGKLWGRRAWRRESEDNGSHGERCH